jgi:hypothetical protein
VLRALGARLRKESCGGVVECMVGGGETVLRLFYTSAPATPELVYLAQDVIVSVDSSVLADLATMYDRRNGKDARWKCQKKDKLRVRACCVKSGVFPRIEGTGKRKRASLKVRCEAAINTAVSPDIPSYQTIYAAATAKSRVPVFVERSLTVSAAHAAAAGYSMPREPSFKLTCVTSFQLSHNGHGSDTATTFGRSNLTTRRIYSSAVASSDSRFHSGDRNFIK